MTEISAIAFGGFGVSVIVALLAIGARMQQLRDLREEFNTLRDEFVKHTSGPAGNAIHRDPDRDKALTDQLLERLGGIEKEVRNRERTQLWNIQPGSNG